MTRVQELIAQVKALSPDEREEFDILLGSDELDWEPSEEWKQEISRRVTELESGKVPGIPWEEVEQRLERRLRGGSWD